MSAEGEIVGMVDVLKLTYATLDQVNTMSTGDSEGPAWNKFWMSFDHETESMMSGEGGSRHPHTPDTRSLMSPELAHRPGVERLESVAPADSASHNGRDSPEPSALTGATTLYEDTPFPFKFKAPSGRMHRLQVVASEGMHELIESVAEKLGSEAEAIGGVPVFEDGRLGHAGFALSYLDNEGDTVSITTDRDLLDAIGLARQGNRDKVDLFIHDPEQPPMAATLAPQPIITVAPTPPESRVRSRKQQVDEEEEAEEMQERRKERRPASSHGKPETQPLIGGVPNELLLPGAIVTLAVVIIGVFAISRASSR